MYSIFILILILLVYSFFLSICCLCTHTTNTSAPSDTGPVVCLVYRVFTVNGQIKNACFITSVHRLRGTLYSLSLSFYFSFTFLFFSSLSVCIFTLTIHSCLFCPFVLFIHFVAHRSVECFFRSKSLHNFSPFVTTGVDFSLHVAVQLSGDYLEFGFTPKVGTKLTLTQCVVNDNTQHKEEKKNKS